MSGKKEDKQDSSLRTTSAGELVGYDMLQARAWALEHAQRELPARHRWLRDVPPDIPLLWEVASSRSIEEQDCYEVVVACYPDEGAVRAKARWTYHIDMTGRPAPGTPVLDARLEWTAPPLKETAPPPATTPSPASAVASVGTASGGKLFRLERRFAEEMFAHARAEAPNMCCGLLAGKGDKVLQVYRGRTTEQSPRRYNLDPVDQLRIMEEIDARGWELLGIYHSDNTSNAYPSSIDVRLAFTPTLYFIVSLKDPAKPVLRAFHIEQETGSVREEELTLA